MKRKHKSYSKPKRPFDSKRFEEEAELKKEFGLKNKREIWKAEKKISVIRKKAKRRISEGEDKQKSLFKQLNSLGFKVGSIADVLGMEVKDYLKRRLQTFVFQTNLAKTPREARQLISHRKILVEGSVVDKPSYLIKVSQEKKISLKEKVQKLAKQEDSTPLSEKIVNEKKKDIQSESIKETITEVAA